MLADHQSAAVPWLRAALSRYRGALLADAPGTGKTRIALALARIYRDEAVSIEVIVPAALVPQWREGLNELEIPAAVLTHDSLANLPYVPSCRRRFLIVDEAHAFRNPATKRYDALARRIIAADVLLVTATPVCNRAGDLRALLALIVADDALVAMGLPSIDAVFERADAGGMAMAVGQLVLRRDRAVVPPALQFGTLLRRRIPYELSPALDAVVEAIGSLAFPLLDQANLVRRFFLYRWQSSDAALLETIRRQARFYTRAIDAVSHGRALTRNDYRRIFTTEAADGPMQQILFWNVFVDAATSTPIRALEGELERLAALSRLIELHPSAKSAVLLEVVESLNDAALIFTTSVATARDLHRVLARGRRVAIATGASPRAAAVAIEEFRRGRLELLVATDLASEGLNLQLAGCVIHYDIPWNPVRLDQRNGRMHRIGQRRSQVTACYFVPEPDLCGVTPVVLAKSRLRVKIERATAAEASGASTMRSRLHRSDPAARLAEVAERGGLQLDPGLLRRHRAGIDRLMSEMCAEWLDSSKLMALNELVRADAGAENPVLPAHGR